MTWIDIRTGAGEENVGEVWCDDVQGPYVPDLLRVQTTAEKPHIRVASE